MTTEVILHIAQVVTTIKQKSLFLGWRMGGSKQKCNTTYSMMSHLRSWFVIAIEEKLVNCAVQLLGKSRNLKVGRYDTSLVPTLQHLHGLKYSW
jgi:hypothetical protein